mmetsp:Transcript_68677/g.223514  ORF Transcript_68677/g.223514 Transcript_68677/m.223514 type:complete len:416 (+) Transcript_68677:653-1900(+)
MLGPTGILERALRVGVHHRGPRLHRRFRWRRFRRHYRDAVGQSLGTVGHGDRHGRQFRLPLPGRRQGRGHLPTGVFGSDRAVRGPRGRRRRRLGFPGLDHDARARSWSARAYWLGRLALRKPARRRLVWVGCGPGSTDHLHERETGLVGVTAGAGATAGVAADAAEGAAAGRAHLRRLLEALGGRRRRRWWNMGLLGLARLRSQGERKDQGGSAHAQRAGDDADDGLSAGGRAASGRRPFRNGEACGAPCTLCRSNGAAGRRGTGRGMGFRPRRRELRRRRPRRRFRRRLRRRVRRRLGRRADAGRQRTGRRRQRPRQRRLGCRALRQWWRKRRRRALGSGNAGSCCSRAPLASPRPRVSGASLVGGAGHRGTASVQGRSVGRGDRDVGRRNFAGGSGLGSLGHLGKHRRGLGVQ